MEQKDGSLHHLLSISINNRSFCLREIKMAKGYYKNKGFPGFLIWSVLRNIKSLVLLIFIVYMLKEYYWSSISYVDISFFSKRNAKQIVIVPILKLEQRAIASDQIHIMQRLNGCETWSVTVKKFDVVKLISIVILVYLIFLFKNTINVLAISVLSWCLIQLNLGNMKVE